MDGADISDTAVSPVLEEKNELNTVTSPNTIPGRIAAITSHWLLRNYQEQPGAHVAREDLYSKYQAYCSRINIPFMNTANFGKVIRALYPNVTTRRLGNRGHSRYHYYGLRQLSESEAMEPPPPEKIDQQMFHEIKPAKEKKKRTRVSKVPRVRTKISTSSSQVQHHQDSDTPHNSVDQMLVLALPQHQWIQDGAGWDYLQTFFEGLKFHSRSLVDHIWKGRFAKAEECMVLFWKEIPPTWYEVLNHPETARVVADWDSNIFQSLLTAIIPDVIGPVDKVLLKELKSFTSYLPTLYCSIFTPHLPNIQSEKTRVIFEFAKIVKQYHSLNLLAGCAAKILSTPHSMERMESIWGALDFDSISTQTLYVCPEARDILRQILDDVTHKITNRDSLTLWATWIFNMVEEFLPHESKNVEELIYCSQNFIVKWAYISSIITRDIQVRYHEAFGAAHILRLFADEYVKYLIDCRIEEKRKQSSLPMQMPQQKQDQWQQLPPHPNHSAPYTMDIFSPSYTHTEFPNDFMGHQHQPPHHTLPQHIPPPTNGPAPFPTFLNNGSASDLLAPGAGGVSTSSLPTAASLTFTGNTYGNVVTQHAAPDQLFATPAMTQGNGTMVSMMHRAHEKSSEGGQQQ